LLPPLPVRHRPVGVSVLPVPTFLVSKVWVKFGKSRVHRPPVMVGVLEELVVSS